MLEVDGGGGGARHGVQSYGGHSHLRSDDAAPRDSPFVRFQVWNSQSSILQNRARSSQRASGMSPSAAAMFASSSATDRTPVSTHSTAGWRAGNCSAAAVSGTSWRAQIAAS